MAKLPVYNLQGKSIGEIELADEVFGHEVNEDLLYEVVKAQLASRRGGNAKTKNRAEVSGTTKKFVKQKGSGGARHGDRNAPNFVGGGQVHGPTPRSYAYRPTRKMRLGALISALSMKAKTGTLKIVDGFELAEVKTRHLEGVLKSLDVTRGSLLVDAKDNNKLRLSTRNLPDHQFLPPEGVNVYDLLRHPHLVLTRSAAKALELRAKPIID